MTAADLYALTGVVLFVVALHAVIVHRPLLRRIMALNVMGSGVFLVIGALARRAPGELADPVPHALVITGIVVAIAATALALALMLRVQAQTGRSELPPAGRA